VSFLVSVKPNDTLTIEKGPSAEKYSTWTEFNF
jgi:hypothetical protein